MASVPHFVLRLDDGQPSSTCHRAKVMFTVPSELAVALAAYPILCRGSSFALEVENGVDALTTVSTTGRNDRANVAVAGSGNSNSNQTVFLTTVLESPRPEETAQDIAQRIAVRMEHIDSFQVATADGFLGF